MFDAVIALPVRRPRLRDGLPSFLAAALAVLINTLLAPVATAQVSAVNTRAEMVGPVLNWHSIYCPGALPCSLDVPPAATPTGVGSLDLSITGASPGLSTQGAGIGGNWASGDPVLFTNAAGAITLRFDEEIFAFGAEVSQTAFGAFTVRVSAFDALDQLLGVRDVAGVFQVGNGPHPFAGLRSVTGIRRIDLEARTDGGVLRPVSLNQATIETAGPSTTVPEPGTYLLLASGLLVLAGVRRARRVQG